MSGSENIRMRVEQLKRDDEAIRAAIVDGYSQRIAVLKQEIAN